MKRDTGRMAFGAAVLALAGLFFVAAVFAGRAMVLSKHVFYNSVLLGIDALRFIRILTEPGIHNIFDLERSNVHPLFSLLVKPWAPLIQKAGITQAVSGIVVNAAAGGGALLLAAWFYRRRGLARLDAWLLTLLTAASAAWVCMSAIPGSYIFSLNFIILSFILADWTLKHHGAALAPAARWGREALWLLVGLLNYGITVSNGMLSFLAYGFGRREGWRGWARACLYGALVLGIGMALTVLVGSSLNMAAERQWYENDALRGGTPPFMSLITIVTPTLWAFVVPWPTLHGILNQGQYIQIAGILHWNFTLFDWALLACWGAILAGAVGTALSDHDPLGRRLSAGMAAGLAFHMVMHRFYFHAYEGVFFFTPHALFLVTGLCAPLMLRLQECSPAVRRGVRVCLFVFAVTLALRNYHYFYTLLKIVPLP